MSVLPRFIDYGLEEPLRSVSAEGTALLVDEEIPLGWDVAWDAVTGDLMLTADGDLRLFTEGAALVSWVTIAVGTSRGQDVCYAPEFGSDLATLVGAGFPRPALQTQVAEMLNSALLRHDRIVSVDDLTISIDSTDQQLTFSAVVTLDDSARVTIQGALNA